jgi:DNA-binding SARP family transcriptional activator
MSRTMARAHPSNGTLANGAHARSDLPGEQDLRQEAFQQFPYSLIVFDRHGRLAAANLQARQLIETMGLGNVELTCCKLLGCRSTEGVLADICLSELAQARGHALPEVRVDLPVADGVRAMWVTAAPLGTGVVEDTGDRDSGSSDDGEGDGDSSSSSSDARSTILQLRPGLAQDRRRRTDPHWMSGPRLRIRVLGRTLVESPEGPIGGDWLDQRTGQLLKYLIAERHRSVHVDEIGESIWPSADFAIAGSVRYYIHTLRARLEPDRGRRAPSRFISSNSGSYRLNLSHIEIDADAFEQHITAGLAALEHDPQLAATEFERGLTLYQGDFLADSPYADWAMLERHRLHDLACIGLRHLTAIRLQARLIDSAARSLEQLASLQPYDEGVHRQLMELDIMRGRRSDAVRRYASLRARIRRTFGHDPDFTPADLAPAGPASGEEN